MSVKELREMSLSELGEELTALLREAFNFRMQKGSDQLTKPHLYRKVRRNIARIKTILSEKAGDHNE